MSSPSAGDAGAMMQVVDYEETFNLSLDGFLKENGVAARGFEYNVAAIMGPQSSGKSTLLNMLFGTGFRTMDADAGRYQVTQGVWLGRDAPARTVVMDLEGTDSRERGEDAATFERKSALFALALAEVLIVNVWTQDVGRFNAANLSLLKTVMELDLQLFFGGGDANEGREGGEGGDASPRVHGSPRMHKTRLLFVLRDHYGGAGGGTPLERLEAILRQDVDNIWNSIAKPDAAKGTDVADYFDLDFHALPHKVLDPDGFVAAGAGLKQRFDDGEVFLPEYSRGVAADGFAAYAESVWETVRANKELDIPSQKEMLAHVRCEEIAREAVEGVQAVLEPMRSALRPETGGVTPVDGMYPAMLEACDAATEAYRASAFRYSKPVAEMKAADLSSKLSSDCMVVYDAQTTAVADVALADFRKELLKIQRRVKPWNEWGAKSQGASNTALSLFDGKCAPGTLSADVLPPAKNTHPLAFVHGAYKTARARLSGAVEQELGRATDDVLAKAGSGCAKMFVDSFKPPLTTALDAADDNVWQRVSDVADAAWEKTERHAKEVYGESGLAFGATECDDAVLRKLQPDCVECAIRTIKEMVGTESNFLHRMVKRFDDKFRFDDRGVPRHFGPDEDLENLFVDSRKHGEELVSMLATVKLSGALPRLVDDARPLDEDAINRVIFEEHVQNDLQDKLRRRAAAVFMEAKRAQEAAKVRSKIPAWLFVLLFIFGWNEIMYVLRSPALFALLLIAVPALYVGYTMDGGNLLGPAVRVAVQPYVKQAVEFAEQFTKTDEAAPPAQASTADSSSSVSDSISPAPQ